MIIYELSQYKSRFCPVEGLLMHITRYFSATLPKAYQENTLDIAVDTLRSLVSISITKTLYIPPNSWDTLACVSCSNKVGGA